MRTTVTIDEALLEAAKRRALDTGRTLSAVVEEALRALLAPRPEPRGEPFRMPTFAGRGVRAGVDLDDSAALLDLMEGA